MALTVKQRKFVDAYQGQANGNATEAARLAGYKGNSDTLRQVAAENLAKPYIKAALVANQKECPLRIDREARQEWLGMVMHGAIEVTAEQTKAVDMLNKMGGDYTETREQKHSGTIGLTFERV